MDFGIDKLKEMGYSEVCLWVLKENHRAVKFYETYGFTFEGGRKEIYIGKSLVEVRYLLSLT